MKVLWVINSILPEMSAYINGNVYNKASSSNSWVVALLRASCGFVELTIVMFYKGDKIVIKDFDGYSCIAIPYRGRQDRYNKKNNDYFQQVNDLVNPDVVHVHGTEYPHTLNALEVFGPDKVVVSIQGLVSVIERYYISDIKFYDILRNLTVRNIIFGDSIWGQKRAFRFRGKYEVQSLLLANNVIGRTLWDKVHTTTINPHINYYHLDELLREEFFVSPKWSYENCEKQTIFMCQATYPIKGLHKVLQALAIVKKKYPDVKLKIAGKTFLKTDTYIEKLAYSGYAKYINRIIKQYNLNDNIEFTGILAASGMIKEYLRCNVYLCPSNIENSPNSMCEAQILGVPSVLSFVGGIYDMTENGRTANIYRFEEVEMMAYYIQNIFQNPGNESQRIISGISLAERRHDKTSIINNLLRIYAAVKKGNKPSVYLNNC